MKKPTTTSPAINLNAVTGGSTWVGNGLTLDYSGVGNGLVDPGASVAHWGVGNGVVGEPIDVIASWGVGNG